MIEYRICWAASSNASFHGQTDWEQWSDEDESAMDVEDTLNKASGFLSEGLATALDASGFEWWVETRHDDV